MSSAPPSPPEPRDPTGTTVDLYLERAAIEQLLGAKAATRGWHYDAQQHFLRAEHWRRLAKEAA